MPRDAVERVQAMFEAFNRLDVEAALPYLHPECEMRPLGTAERLGRAEPYRGHDGVREYFADVARVWDGLTVIPEKYRAVAGSVVVFGRVEGVDLQDEVLWVWKLRDGLVISGQVFSTRGAAMAAANTPD
jgi:ketosteroid isomerase-like protein